MTDWLGRRRVISMMVSAYRGPNRSTQCATDNSTFPAADFVANRGACGTTDTATDGRIPSGVVSISLEG